MPCKHCFDPSWRSFARGLRSLMQLRGISSLRAMLQRESWMYSRRRRLPTTRPVHRNPLKHTASLRFWRCLDGLPSEIQSVAHRSFALIKTDPYHPSLHFKTVGNGRFHSVRVGLYYRALGLPVASDVHWFWIGSHSEDDRLIG